MATVAIIGDSLTERRENHAAPPIREADTRARLVAAGFSNADIYWYGRGGKGLVAPDSNGRTTMQNIVEAQTQLGSVDVWVMALGTNNGPDSTPTFRANVETVLDAIELAGGGKVLWVNLAFWSSNNTNSTTHNPTIRSAVEARGGTVLDWHTFIHNPKDAADWIYPTDGTHHTTQGSVKRDNFIISGIQAALSASVPIAGSITLSFVDGDGDEQVVRPYLLVDDVEVPYFTAHTGIDVPESDPDDDPEPEPEPSRVLLGAYFGNYNNAPDHRFQSLTGRPADVLSTYYQAQGVGGGMINAPAENARIANGTVPLITVTSADGPWTHAQIGSGAADGWLDYWANAIASLADGEIWVTFDHEFEVKRNQGKFAWSPTDVEYAAAFNRFRTRVKNARAASGRQQVKFLYWWGYFRTAEIDNIGQLITAHEPPDMLAFDPYVFSHWAAGTTFEQMVMGSGKLDWTKARSWYQGQPIGLAEFGKDAVHGQAQVAAFLTDLRGKMHTLGLTFALYFSRDKPGDVMLDITPAGSWLGWPGTSGTYSKSDGSLANGAAANAFIASVQAT